MKNFINVLPVTMKVGKTVVNAWKMLEARPRRARARGRAPRPSAAAAQVVEYLNIPRPDADEKFKHVPSLSDALKDHICLAIKGARAPDRERPPRSAARGTGGR